MIQGAFLCGRATVPPPVRTRQAPPPLSTLQAKPAIRSPGFPAPAVAARPPGPPMPAFAGRSGMVQRHAAPGAAFAVDPGQIGLTSGGGRPLPEGVRGKMEAALGANFNDVRVHVGPQAERIGAVAFTIGSDIYFAPGRFQPETVHGQQLLGHELAHVVQQRQGRVRNPLGAGVAVVQDRALEAEADRAGHRAVAFRAAVERGRAPKTVQRSAPARGPRAVLFGSRPAGSAGSHGRTGTIQAQLTFDSGPAQWMDDKAHCAVCWEAMSSGHRHHCRVCGQSVCDDCSSRKFTVRSPQTSSGKGKGSSVERVCVDCVLKKKIEVAKARSPKFLDLITTAGNPYVRWEAGCWPNCSSKGIRLNPTRGDVFATYIFELTNAVGKLSTLPSPSAFDSAMHYAYHIEHQEYMGTIWADEVVVEINARQNDFAVDRRFPENTPDQNRFLIHLEAQHRGEHTKKYYEQATKDPSQVAKAKDEWSVELERARNRPAWDEVWNARNTPGYTSFPPLKGE